VAQCLSDPEASQHGNNTIICRSYGFLERLGLLVILSGALPAQQPAKSTEGPQPRRLYGRYLCTRSGFSVHGVPYAQALFATDHRGRSALFDYDNDGRLDLLLVNGAPIKDPATKGTILAENWAQLLESSLSPEVGRHFRGCYRESWLAGSRVWGNRDVLVFALTLVPDAHE